MHLKFPNPSRHFDPVKRCIRFKGYDGVFEVAFELDVEALQYLSPGIGDGEPALLAAFDIQRERIERVAVRSYSGRRRDVIRLSRANF